MSDDILDKIKSGQPVTSKDIKKNTEGLKSLNEGLTVKYYSVETSSDHSSDNNKPKQGN